jgi:hypothetical protein
MSAEIIPVIPAVMISTGVVSWANPPVSGQQVTSTATPGRHHDARTLLVVSTAVQISPLGAARTVILAGLLAAYRRVRVRLATAPRPRTVIDINLMDRRREHPRCPVSRLAGSRLRSDADYQMHSDPTYLNANEYVHDKHGDEHTDMGCSSPSPSAPIRPWRSLQTESDGTRYVLTGEQDRGSIRFGRGKAPGSKTASQGLAEQPHRDASGPNRWRSRVAALQVRTGRASPAYHFSAR